MARQRPSMVRSAAFRSKALTDLLQLRRPGACKLLILLRAMSDNRDIVVPRFVLIFVDFGRIDGDTVRTTIESALGSPPCIFAGRPRQAAPICKSSKADAKARRCASR